MDEERREWGLGRENWQGKEELDHSGKRKLACTRTKRADLNKWEESGGRSRAIGQMEEEEGIGYLILKVEKR